MRIGRWGMASLLALGLALPAVAQTGDAAARREAMLARARAAELPGTWTPAPGDPLSHFTAGYAKLMCSAVFISGMDPAFAQGTLGDSNALAAVAHRMKAGEPVIDRAKKEVRVTTKAGVTRIARLAGDQGCVPISEGDTGFRFTPKAIAKTLPPATTTPWPMGDKPDTSPLPAGLDAAKLKAAVDTAFAPDDALTQAYVVTWKGRIVAERYGPQADANTPLEGWSMGKSVAATLLGVQMQQGVYTLDQPAPFPEWQTPGDPRQAIRIRDILQMSSGLRIRAEQDPEYAYDGRYPDHWYYYTGPNAFQWAATRPLQWKPGTIGRYRNTDPVLTNYLVKLGAEKLGQDYLSFPQRALFDKLGIRSAVLETDTHGQFLTQGAELMTARDWARLGQLYLQDGVWNGERLLPEGFAKFVGTVAPAWAADQRPIYGGLFWVNGDKTFPTPEDTYYMAGAGGQWTIIIPSHDLVVVRLGRYAGERVARENVRRSLGLLMQAVPPST
ncbi:serine hydrolase domain-containing protein [Sphingoaurantiacus capsulatus]|uniref:Serine hydrolase domain-containing protein n=1 Tax=Sphingoaurantiacus capsulatus TaxID=1771310 RepID=A0ABV7XBP7_9SPHN